MTDRNVNRRIFLSLYTELFSKCTELMWAAEEQAKTNRLFGGQSLEDEKQQTERMTMAVLPVRQAVSRMLQLLLTPDTREMNSYCLDHDMQGDVYLLCGLEAALGGTYDEVRATAEEYGQKILDRLSVLYLHGADAPDGEERFGENITFDMQAPAGDFPAAE